MLVCCDLGVRVHWRTRCGQGSGVIATALRVCVTKLALLFFQVSRILKPDGIFISITFCQPHFRKPLYAKDTYGWSIECQTIGETFHFFFYVMRKGQKLSTADIALSLEYEERLRRSNAGDVHFLTDSEDEDFLLKSCELNKEV